MQKGPNPIFLSVFLPMAPRAVLLTSRGGQVRVTKWEALTEGAHPRRKPASATPRAQGGVQKQPMEPASQALQGQAEAATAPAATPTNAGHPPPAAPEAAPKPTALQQQQRCIADSEWWTDAACVCEERVWGPEGREMDAAEPDI